MLAALCPHQKKQNFRKPFWIIKMGYLNLNVAGMMEIAAAMVIHDLFTTFQSEFPNTTSEPQT